MSASSWRRTNFYKNTRRSGSQFETSVVEMVKRYTDAVWRNIRIETLLSDTGTTELDVVFYSGGIVYILELKRVRKIVGSYERKRWTLYGWSGHYEDSGEYTALNVIEQNNIHARSLLDVYFSEFRCFPTVVPLIIVPDDCIVPPNLKSEIFTMQDLEDFMLSNHIPGRADVGYRLSFLLGAGTVVQRSDFVDRTGLHGEAIRGRKGVKHDF